MKKDFYEEHFRNGFIIGCMPVSSSLIALIHKDYPIDDDDYRELNELPIRVLYYVPKKMDKGDYGTTTWSHNIENLYITDDGTSWIVTTPYFEIDEIENKTDWYPIPNNEKGHLAKGITNIDGTVYAYGMVRSVFKRTDIKQWENITTKIKHPNLYMDIEASKEELVGSWVGFSALDGFNENDIYAGGNKGDSWHYNGKSWDRIDLPLNTDISTITCTPNDLVYISCRIGSVLAGRLDSWEIIDSSKQITHSAWFKGKIYFVDMLGRIYTHNEGDKELTEAVFKTQFPDYMHHLIKGIASCEECLVIYTEVQAYAYDGENWHEIIEIPSLSKNK